MKRFVYLCYFELTKLAITNLKVIIAADSKSLKLSPNKDASLIQETYKMFVDEYGKEKIIIQCTSDIEDDIKILLPDSNLYSEPEKKGTAIAIGLAAIRMIAEDDNEPFAVAYSVHPVSFKEKLISTLSTCVQFNKNLDKIILLGVNPTYPETNYGYAKIGKVIESTNGTIAFEMTDFVEKPDKETAMAFLNTWCYLWNTGYMLARPKQLLSIYKETLPDVYKGLMTIKESLNTNIENEIMQTVFKKLNRISIDNGIYEKASNEKIAIVPVDLDIKNF